MEGSKVIQFESLTQKLGRFELTGKKFLIPQMNRIGGHLLAGTFRSFGIRALVMDTYKGMALGNEYTSGKECYPCQITMGDILYFMKKEQEAKGSDFDPEDYVYFMPESSGPCRFGMYNKYQRIVLDSFPQLSRIRIGSLTTEDGYSLAGIIEEERVTDLRKTAYFSVLAADILDRLLWRVRPYEKEPGMTDVFIEKAMRKMEASFEVYGSEKRYDEILRDLEGVVKEARTIINPGIPPKPLVGIVGEIYLRTHEKANQDLIRLLESYGAEVVNASIAEWMNYTSYDRFREAKKAFRLSVKQFRLSEAMSYFKRILNFGGDLFYQQHRQRQMYNRIGALLDIAEDHKVSHLDRLLEEEGFYSFEAGTEACLSIPGIIHYAREGYNGVVNVYPFTCMPSTITSAIAKPLLQELGIPYLDTPYDSSFQPGREAAIRTFMYQARQHFERNGRRSHQG